MSTSLSSRLWGGVAGLALKLGLASLLFMAWMAASFLEGRVVSRQGVSIAGARVDLMTVDGSVRSTVATDSEGRFRAPRSSDATRVRVRRPGFFEIEVALPTMDQELEIVLTAASFTEDVAVTATRRERALFDTPQSVSVVREQDMNDLALTSVPAALEGLPGVLVQRTTLGGGAPFIRGLVGNRVLILVDGIRLNNSTYRLGPNQYLNTVDRFSTERTEVVRGPTSSLYGSDALGGTVNLLTEEVPTGTDSVSPSFSLSYDGATNAPLASARVRGSSGRFGFLGGFTVASFDDIRGGRETGVQAPTGFRRRAADIKLAYDLSDRGTLSGVAQFFEDEDVPRYDRIDSGRDDIHLFDPQRRILGYVRYQNQLDDLGSPTLSATLSRVQQTEGRTIRSSGSSTKALERDDVTTYGLGFQLTWPERQRMEWTAGFELYDDSIASSRVRQNLDMGETTNVRGRFPDGSSYRSTALYAQAGVRAASRLNLLLGGRYNRFHTDANLVGLEEPYEATFDALTGSANVLFQVTPNVHVSGGVSEGFRAPGIDDAAIFGEFNAGFEVPNPELEPETLLNYEVTLKVHYPKLWTSFTVFDANLEGLINRAPGTFRGSPTFLDEPVFQRQNIDEGEITGAEVDFGWWPADRLSLSLTLTTLRGTNTRTNEALDRIPPTMGRFRARGYLPWKSAWLELMADFAAKQARLSPGDLRDSRIPDGGTPGYFVVSVNAGIGSPDRWQLNVVFHNLTDADYRFHGSGINGPGRSVRVFAMRSFD